MKNPFLVLLVGLVFMAGCGGGSSHPPTSITLSPNTTTVIDEGQSLNFNAVLLPQSVDQAVVWSLGGLGTLSNQTATAVTYTAPSSGAAGSSTITATATNATSVTSSVQVDYNPPLTITTTSLAPAAEGAPYDQTIKVTGGTGTLTFSLAGGTTLPNGLTMDSDGRITGSATGPAGTTNFSVAVTDSSMATPQTIGKDLSITVELPSSPVISPTALPGGHVGTPYYQTLTVKGGLGPNYKWSVNSGSLPDGLILVGSNSTATISGIPTNTQSNVNFGIEVTDSSAPPQSATQSYTVSIGSPLSLSITTTSLPPATLNEAYSTTVSAQGGLGPYTFTLDAASKPLPPGLSFSSVNNQGVISGTPTSIGQYPNIIVNVKDSASTPATAQATFTLNVIAQTLTISPSTLPAGTVGTAYSQTITAGGAVSPYTFSLDSASKPLPPGLSFTTASSQATIGGTPTAAGTYDGILVDAQDSETPPVVSQQSYSITVFTPTTACGTGNESILSGQYAFLLQGFDVQGPVGIVGSFTADGTGQITAGVEDINRSAGVATNLALTASSSSYSVGSDNRGCLNITTSQGTETFRFSLGSAVSGIATQGRVLEFDSSGTETAGIVVKQDTTAFSNQQVSGSYAFGGSTPLSGEGRAGIAGQFVASNGNITSGSMDLDVNGSSQPLTGVTGTYDVTSNGRGAIILSSVATPINASFYVVSADKMLFLSTDKQSVNSPLAGTILRQTTPFSVSSINGTAVFASEGLGTTAGTSAVRLGLLSTDGAGNFSFVTDQNDGGSVTSKTLSGTYTIGPNGRVTLKTSTIQPVIYLFAQNQGFVVGVSTSVETGTIDAQSIGPFSNASLSGTYFFGTEPPVTDNLMLSAGVATADGAGNLTGTLDEDNAGTLAGGQALSTTYSVSSSGRAMLGGNADILYVISPTKAVYMPAAAGTRNPTITFLEQ